MFLWESVGGLWATKSEGVGLSVRAISFQDFQPMWSWSTNVTDRRTDRRTTCNLNTALCTSASRVKNWRDSYVVMDWLVLLQRCLRLTSNTEHRRQLAPCTETTVTWHNINRLRHRFRRRRRTAAFLTRRRTWLTPYVCRYLSLTLQPPSVWIHCHHLMLLYSFIVYK